MADGLISVDVARAAVLERVREPLASERVSLDAAQGRVLAEEAVASEDVPGFDNSAMDGFAVRAVDTLGASRTAPGRLRIAGEARAGAPAERALEPGEAFRISTGAALPAGADSILRLEEVVVEGDELVFQLAAAPGRDVRRVGDDIRAGAAVLRAGTPLGAAEVGVLAALGVPEPSCARRPRLAVVCTGDELLAPDEPMRPGGVRNSNAYTVPALGRGAGAEPVQVTRVGDAPDRTRETLAAALAEADVVVACGGVSVGEHDHVRSALAELGVEEAFWGVALRPGKPTWFGTAGEKLVFGLPGNPVSAFVTFVLFVRPALRALTGADSAGEGTAATLAEDVPRLPTRDQAVRCSLELTSGGWLATPAGPQGSHVLTSLLGADALATVEAGSGRAAAGSLVQVELLRA